MCVYIKQDSFVQRCNELEFLNDHIKCKPLCNKMRVNQLTLANLGREIVDLKFPIPHSCTQSSTTVGFVLYLGKFSQYCSQIKTSDLSVRKHVNLYMDAILLHLRYWLSCRN